MVRALSPHNCSPTRTKATEIHINKFFLRFLFFCELLPRRAKILDKGLLITQKLFVFLTELKFHTRTEVKKTKGVVFSLYI